MTQKGPAIQSPSTTRSRRNIPRGWLVRVAGSLALLGATLAILPLDQLGDAIARLNLATLAVVLAAFLALHVAAALKWRMLCDRRMPALVAIRAHLAGLAGNLCLPGVIGGDIVRCGIVARAHGDTAHLVSASIVDRVVDMVALLFVSAAGLVAVLLLRAPTAAGNGTTNDMVVFFAVGVAAVAVLGVTLSALPWLLAHASAMPLPGRLRAGLTKVAEAFRAVASSQWRIAFALTRSIAIQAGLATLAFLLTRKAGVEIGAAPWLFAWPLAKILAALPVSLGGLGVREATLALLLAPFVSDLAGVVAASLAWQVVLFLGGLVGGAIWLASELAASQRFRPGSLAAGTKRRNET